MSAVAILDVVSPRVVGVFRRPNRRGQSVQKRGSSALLLEASKFKSVIGPGAHDHRMSITGPQLDSLGSLYPCSDPSGVTTSRVQRFSIYGLISLMEVNT